MSELAKIPAKLVRMRLDEYHPAILKPEKCDSGLANSDALVVMSCAARFYTCTLKLPKTKRNILTNVWGDFHVPGRLRGLRPKTNGCPWEINVNFGALGWTS